MFASSINHTLIDLFREYEQNYNLKVSSIKLFTNMESHLLQMRGLKLYHFKQSVAFSLSHLLQMRGLKQFDLLINKCTFLSRIFYRCVD